MNKHLAAILALIATALPVTLSAAVPLRWTVETSRVQPAQFEAYHGETIEFAATMQSYGKPLAITNDLIGIYWQTNGMGSAYWTAPAALSNNVMTARFEPSMDVGANVYSCFIGCPGEIYRAAFQLRLRPSPGAVPAELPLPVKTLDFAQVQILHAPYYSKSETDAKIIELAPAPGNYATVSNCAMSAVQPAAIADMETQTHAAQTYQPKGQYLTSETDPTVSSAISAHDSSTAAHNDIRTALAGKQDTISDLATIRSGAAAGATAVQPASISDMETQTHAAQTYQPKGQYLTSETDPTVSSAISTHNSSTSAHSDIRSSISNMVSKVNGESTTNGNVDVKRVYNSDKTSYIDGDGDVYNATIPADTFVSNSGEVFSCHQYDTSIFEYKADGNLTYFRISEGETIGRVYFGSTWNRNFTLSSPYRRNLSDGITFSDNGKIYTYNAKSTFSPVPSDHLARTTDVCEELAAKQPIISDLATIRSGAAAGATAVQPSAISDMESRTHAAATYQPIGNYLTTESDPTVSSAISTHNSSTSAHNDLRTSIAAKYSKPSGGIPKTDLASAVQTSLGKADSALQSAHNTSTTAHSDIRTAVANAQAHSEATRQIVSTWEGFLDGSNVVFSITNYISGTYSLDHAKLQIKELLPDSNEYRIVYDSRTEITNHTAAAKREIVGYVDGVATELRGEIAEKGDKAWGRRSSTGQDVPISNTVWVTEQNLRIAGGMEYERVAVGEGAIYVLTSKGQTPYMIGDEGALMLKDDGGTNYFGMVRSDSYTIGCNTDGIRTQNNLVYLDYAVTMSDHPCIWYTESLEGDVVWEQLNLPDGSAVPGASHTVIWDESPRLGAQECYINCPEGSGFFRATIEVSGDARFRTNMPAEIPSFWCADDPTKKVKIIWNNGNPKFTEAP